MHEFFLPINSENYIISVFIFLFRNFALHKENGK